MSLTFANKVTICRILSVPFFIWSVLYYAPERDYLRYVALGIFLFAVVSDVIDGYIARTRHERTTAGAVLDPLADKILLVSAFLCLYKVGVDFPGFRFPLWLVVPVISRDVILLVGATLLYIMQGNLSMEATKWGKISTFFQVLAVLGMLLQLSASKVIWYLVIVFTVISGVDYLRNGIRLINSFHEKTGS